MPSEQPDPAANASWDSYWRNAGDTAAFSHADQSPPAIVAFWDSVFEPFGDTGPAHLLDVATGSGAVVDQALQKWPTGDLTVSCVDLSPAAIERVSARHPGVNGIVAEASRIPAEDASCDLVTSQFGIEYGGPGAVDEAARLVAPSGTLAALLHRDGSVIHRQSVADQAAVQRLRDAQFIELAEAFFRAGFNAVRGGDRKAYDDAGKAFAPAIKGAEAIIDEFGAGVAGGAIARLYQDVARIHDGIQKYAPEDVLSWITRMQDEFADFSDRMASMCGAAMDGDAFARTCDTLRAVGFDIVRADELMSIDGKQPLAWALVAKR